jgi:hypothetical protein
MDEPTGGEIRRGDSFRVERGELPALTVKMIEDLAARLRASEGHWRIELDLQDGAFQVGWRHDRFGPAGQDSVGPPSYAAAVGSSRAAWGSRARLSLGRVTRVIRSCQRVEEGSSVGLCGKKGRGRPV